MTFQGSSLNSRKEIKKFIQDAFCPNVLIYSTGKVDEISAKSGFESIVDVFHPYEEMWKEKSLQIKTIKEDQVHEVKGLKIRFRSFFEFRAQLESNQKHITEIPTQYWLDELLDQDDLVGEDILDVPSDSFDDITSTFELHKKLIGLEPNTPYFERFRQEFIRFNVKPTPIHTFQHPLAVIFIISSDDHFDNFHAMEDQLKSTLTKFQMNTDIHFHFIVLEDQDNQSSRTRTLFDRMQQTFGVQKTAVVSINGRKDSEPEISDIWTPSTPEHTLYIRRQKMEENVPKCGKKMSKAEEQTIRTLVSQFVTGGLLPHLQAKMQYLHTNVASRHGGKLKSFAKYFGFGGPKRKNEDSLVADTNEILIRRLADYCFMLHDYPSALVNYQKIKDDWKSNKKHFGGLNEMIALCNLLHYGANKESEVCIDTAVQCYIESNYHLLAMRAGLFKAMIHQLQWKNDVYAFPKAASAYVEISSIYEHHPLYVAMLYEQAALCYLFANPTKHRKFAFFMSFAGHRWNTLQKMHSAFRCHKMASLIYKSNWNQIHDHLNITLARLHVNMDELSASIENYKVFIESTNRSVDEQKKFFQEYKETISSYLERIEEKDGLALANLKIPSVDLGDVEVLLKKCGKYIPTDKFPDTTWRKLHEKMVKFTHPKSDFTIPWRWAKFKPKPLSKSPIRTPIQVKFWLKNPTKVPVDVSNLQLIYEFSPKDGEPSDDDVLTNPLSVLLQPEESTNVCLNIQPYRIGQLNIKGFEWTLENLLHGKAEFSLRGKRLNRSKQEKCSKVYEPNNRLNISVVEEEPTISVHAKDPFPKTLMNGEVRRILYTISCDKSGSDAKNIHFLCNHPQIVFVGSPTDETEKAYQFPTLNLEKKLERQDLSEYSSKGKNEKIVKIADSLKAGESITIPIFIYALANGTFDVRFLFFFEGMKNVTDISDFGFLHMKNQLRVENSLHLHVFTQPSFRETENHIVGLALSIGSLISTISIDQVTAVGKNWKIEPISNDSLSLCDLHSNQSLVLYFRISRITPEDSNSVYHSRQQLGLQQQLIDTTSSPTLDFFCNSLSNPMNPKEKNDLYFLEGNGLSLLVHWNSGKRIFGQSTSKNVYFSPMDTTKLRYPLSISLLHEREVYHDFNQSSCCVVTVMLQIKNDLASKGPTSCKVKFLQKRPIESQNISYIWIGNTEVLVNNLDADSQKTLPIQVCFFEPGIHNLNRFIVQWMDPIEGKTKLNFIHQNYFIHIIDQE